MDTIMVHLVLFTIEIILITLNIGAATMVDKNSSNTQRGDSIPKDTAKFLLDTSDDRRWVKVGSTLELSDYWHIDLAN